MRAIIITTVIVVLGIIVGTVWRIVQTRRRRTLRARWMSQPIPKAWRSIIEKNIPLYNRLPEDLQTQLHGLVNVFVTEKNFKACGDLEMSDEIMVTIAAQASMLLLNRQTHFYPKLKTVYVYPHAYVSKSVQTDGVITVEGKSVRLGESWTNGPVVLSWDSITGGAGNIHDGQNVVIHEFAHQLDQEDGCADGAPILDNRSCYRTWAKVLGKEYEQLCSKANHGQRSVLNKYGATNPAEFFAVATESFFEKPKQMHRANPDLYEELKSYYKVDPLEWHL